MFLQLRTLALALAVVAGLGLGGLAAADTTVPAKGSGDGQVILQINPTPDNPVGVQVYHAAGKATLLGEYTDQGITFFTADGDVLPISFFVLTAADGSTVSGSYSGSFAPIPGTTDFEFNVEAVWESGTGRLASISGGADVVAILDGLTGSFHFDFSGIWILP